LVCIHDITKLKKLEKTSKRIRAMFFSSIAHELRTPLNSIIPISKQLLEKFREDETSRFFVEVILNSAYHLENVVEDALDMSRIENNKFEMNFSTFKIREVLD
jgi:two-component system, OmpR family, phosphate regulon sensor histidine kinase PhoR